MARLFARRGVKATIISTPLNAPVFSKAVERDGQQGHDISIRIIKFPSAEAGLPEGCENLSCINSWDMHANFLKAMSMLQQPIEQLLEECHPHCLVADMTFTWATEVADKLRIPRLYFNGTDQIKTTRQQLAEYLKQTTEHEFTKMVNQISESEAGSYGVLVNSFHELEPAYCEHYRKVMGRKAWHIGPLSLCNRNIEDKAERGNTASIVPAAQLREIALALEASGQNFIWVVRKGELRKHEDKEEWLPEGFERRMEGKGLIIRGWAPQVLILDHNAVGGFMTHCGWNSTLEAVTAGVPLVTWPLYAEQFDNEKLITDVLKIGIGVGALEWSRYPKKILVRKDDMEKAIVQLMVGEEAEEIRNRARELQEMARNAMEEGGSSYSDLTALLEELRALETSKRESAAH
ncbi:scopoletin glucosyltransferase-like [Populus alba x Populus x berolinensis]|uniref:Glycosyltransferase n=1 Tax=Populus alba x Populus x berolinensis TaxID=444605 RepID=A0AAD6RQZ8_9ROSI|nr:scopoletin glucosyltransferase-like [Populus alba x Populus x berolinensis]